MARNGRTGSDDEPIARLTRLRVSNFRSLGEDVELDLGPLTVLAGPNSAGKSNLVDALRFARDCVVLGLRQAVTDRGGFARLSRWTSASRPRSVGLGLDVTSPGTKALGTVTSHWAFEVSPSSRQPGVEVSAETLRSDYTADFPLLEEMLDKRRKRFDGDARFVEFVRGKRDWTVHPTTLTCPRVGDYALGFSDLGQSSYFMELDRFIRGIRIYAFGSDEMCRPQLADETVPMADDARNWATILSSLVARKAHREIVGALHKLTGDLDGLRVTRAGSYLVGEFRHGRNRWFDAAVESDGTLRLTALLLALSQRPLPSLIVIEEPERSMEPKALAVLFDFLKEASQLTTVIVTSHSPDLLDLCSLDDVRVVTREQGVTRVAAVDLRQRQLVRERLALPSELFRAEGLEPARE